MPAAPLPANERERLAALRTYGGLDSAQDEAFDALVRVASSLCETPIALVTLLDESRQRFLSSHGLSGVSETSIFALLPRRPLTSRVRSLLTYWALRLSAVKL